MVESIYTRSIDEVCLLAVVTSLGAQPPEHNFKPVQGYVPDAATAIRIDVAVWDGFEYPRNRAVVTYAMDLYSFVKPFK